MNIRPYLTRGQAVVEYLVVFAFMAMIAIQMAKGLQGFMKNSMGGLNRALTKQLSSGVCTSDCFAPGYHNDINK